MRYVHTIAINVEEERRLRECMDSGYTIMGIFRAGLEGISRVTGAGDALVVKPRTSKKVKSADIKEFVAQKGVGEYGCGCSKTEGKNLCPKHSRA